MLCAADLVAIKLEILHTMVSGFALRGYSGDLEIRMDELGNMLSTKAEIHVKPNGDRGELNHEVLKSLAEHWADIDVWAQHPTTFLLISFQRGRITRVKISDVSLL